MHRRRCGSIAFACLFAWMLVAPVAPAAFGQATLPYEGSWFNQTFMSTGPAHATIVSKPPQVSFTLDLDGSVFGGTDPLPLTLTGTRNPDTSVTFNPVTGHPTYGDVTGSLSATGQITATGTNIPNPAISRVNLTGQFTIPAIDMSYVVNFTAGGSANGIIDLDLIPEPTASVALLAPLALARRGRRRSV